MVPGRQLAQQLLVFPVQAEVIGDSEGLQGEAGESLHQLVAVQMQTEVVSCLRASSDDPVVLQLHMHESQR